MLQLLKLVLLLLSHLAIDLGKLNHLAYQGVLNRLVHVRVGIISHLRMGVLALLLVGLVLFILVFFTDDDSD